MPWIFFVQYCDNAELGFALGKVQFCIIVYIVRRSGFSAQVGERQT